MVTLHLQSGSGEQAGSRTSRPTPSDLLPWEVPTPPPNKPGAVTHCSNKQASLWGQFTFKHCNTIYPYSSIHPSIPASTPTNPSAHGYSLSQASICLASWCCWLHDAKSFYVRMVLPLQTGFLSWAHWAKIMCKTNKSFCVTHSYYRAEHKHQLPLFFSISFPVIKKEEHRQELL